jgi:hypothetical protein
MKYKDKLNRGNPNHKVYMNTIRYVKQILLRIIRGSIPRFSVHNLHALIDSLPGCDSQEGVAGGYKARSLTK